MPAVTQELSFQFYLVVSNELRIFFKKIVCFFGRAGSSLPQAGSFCSFAVSGGLLSTCRVWAAHYGGLSCCDSRASVIAKH